MGLKKIFPSSLAQTRVVSKIEAKFRIYCPSSCKNYRRGERAVWIKTLALHTIELLVYIYWAPCPRGRWELAELRSEKFNSRTYGLPTYLCRVVCRVALLNGLHYINQVEILQLLGDFVFCCWLHQQTHYCGFAPGSYWRLPSPWPNFPATGLHHKYHPAN